jgi:hypothetical protein
VAIHVSTPTTGHSSFHSYAPIGDSLSPTIVVYESGCNVVSSERSVTSPLTDPVGRNPAPRRVQEALDRLLAEKIIRKA